MPSDPSIGVDVKLNSGDLGYTQSGDLDLVGHIEPTDNIWQAVALRLTTTLGTYLFAPGYGTLLGQYIDEPITADLGGKIITEAQTTILQDTRVASVNNMQISQGSGNISLSFTIVTVSGGTKSGTVPIGG